MSCYEPNGEKLYLWWATDLELGHHGRHVRSLGGFGKHLGQRFVDDQVGQRRQRHDDIQQADVELGVVGYEDPPQSWATAPE